MAFVFVSPTHLSPEFHTPKEEKVSTKKNCLPLFKAGSKVWVGELGQGLVPFFIIHAWIKSSRSFHIA